MAFDEALMKAQELGGTTIRFQQTIDCCTGFTARWLKYQLLGRDFWANPPGPKPPIVNPRQVKVTVKDAGSYITNAAAMTPDGNTKVTGIYNRIDQSQADRGKAGKGTVAYLAASEKVGDHYDTLALKQREGTFPDVTLGTLMSDPAYVGAMHISLQTDFDPMKGINPLFAGVFFHSVAAFRRNGDPHVKFFDPNMGEVSVPLDRFRAWFAFYQSLWKRVKGYNVVDYWVLTYIKGVDGLSGAGRAVRKRLRQKRQYALSRTTRRPPPPPPSTTPQQAQASADDDPFAALEASLAELMKFEFDTK